MWTGKALRYINLNATWYMNTKSDEIREGFKGVRRKQKRLHPILGSETLDTIKFFQIICDKSERKAPRMGGDQYVHCANGFAASLQARSDITVMADRLFVKRGDCEWGEKLHERLPIFSRIAAFRGSVF